MKQIFIAALFAATTSTGFADDYASPEFDFTGLPSMEHGVVEAHIPQHPPGLGEVFEHSINPESDDQIVVRLEDGSAVTVEHDATVPLQPGEAVLVVHAHDGARLELAVQ